MVKRLPTMQKTRVQSLGREDLLEKGMATHCSILAPTKKRGSKENTKRPQISKAILRRKSGLPNLRLYYKPKVIKIKYGTGTKTENIDQ